MNKKVKETNFTMLVGKYQIDTNRTKFDEYHNNIKLYEKLTLKLKNDSTFQFNMSVPFIYDSIGKWYTAGNSLDEMNVLVFQSNNAIKTQFTQLFFDKGDSIFFLNSNTPKVGKSSINEVCFRKQY
jgi:hypothetical protein